MLYLEGQVGGASVFVIVFTPAESTRNIENICIQCNPTALHLTWSLWEKLRCSAWTSGWTPLPHRGWLRNTRSILQYLHFMIIFEVSVAVLDIVSVICMCPHYAGLLEFTYNALLCVYAACIQPHTSTNKYGDWMQLQEKLLFTCKCTTIHCYTNFQKFQSTAIVVKPLVPLHLFYPTWADWEGPWLDPGEWNQPSKRLQWSLRMAKVQVSWFQLGKSYKFHNWM